MSILINSEKASIGMMAAIPFVISERGLSVQERIIVAGQTNIHSLRTKERQTELQKKIHAVEILVCQIFNEIKVRFESLEKFVRYSFLAMHEFDKTFKSTSIVSNTLDQIFAAIRTILMHSAQLEALQ